MRGADGFTQLAALNDRIYEQIVATSPKLQRGRVWCRTCDRSEAVDPVQALRRGWPLCCGTSMTLDAPSERGGDQVTQDQGGVA